MTTVSRTKRTIYVVLLCIAIALSTFSIYNQVRSDSTATQFADQISAFCAENPSYVTDKLNCQQAKSVQDNNAPVIAGAKGDKGDKGDKGEQGDTGETGPKGENGTGTPGVDGKNGANGTNGNDGNDGVNGQPGEKGDKGDKGDTGAQGDRGADGQPGENAPRIQSFDFQMQDGCKLVITFDTAPAQTVDAPEVFCVS